MATVSTCYEDVCNGCYSFASNYESVSMNTLHSSPAIVKDASLAFWIFLNFSSLESREHGEKKKNHHGGRQKSTKNQSDDHNAIEPHNRNDSIAAD